MSIPLAMSPVGYDTWVTELRRALITFLGTLHLEVDYLPDEKKLVVHTDRVSDEIYAEVAEIAAEYMPNGVTLVQYNHHWEISWRNINKYAECVNRVDMAAVNPNYKRDLTSDGEWVYPLPNLENASYAFAGASKLRKLHIVLPKAKNVGWMLTCFGGDYSLENLEDVYIEAPVANVTVEALFQSCYGSGYKDIKKLKCVFPNALKLDKLFHSISTQTSLEIICPRITSAYYAFTGLKLDKPSTLNICNQLQSYTSGSHPLGIGIHVDHKYDPEVNTVLKRAGGAPGTTNEYFPPDGVVIDSIADDEYKGWTLTVRWNGTATENAYPAPTTT